MKKTYIRPDITMVNVETSSLMKASPAKWTVKTDVTDETQTPSDWGLINNDKGEGAYDDKDDPWNSDNW